MIVDRFDGRVVTRNSVAVAFFAVLLIAGALAAQEKSPKSKLDQKPSASGTTENKSDGKDDKSVRNVSKPVMRTIAGRVVDEDNKPVAGASLVWQVSYGRPGVTVETTSDDEGRFRCSTPDVVPTFHSRQADELWVYKKGKQLTTANTHRTGKDDQKLAELTIQLPADTAATFSVVTADGTPVPNVKVEPCNYLNSHKGYGLVPESLRQLMASVSDEDGHVEVSSFDRQKMMNLHASCEDLGTQEIRIANGTPGMDVHTLVMRSVGKVKGRLVADDPAIFKRMELYLTSMKDQDSGVAKVQVDDDGAFEVSAIAAGNLHIQMYDDPVAAMLPRIPEQLTVIDGQMLEFEIPFELSVPIEGRIVTSDAEAPVAGAEISVGFGTWRQSAYVQSDAEGRYKARVLAGPVRTQVIAMPKDFENYQQTGEPWNEQTQVAQDGEKPFPLPTIRAEKLIEVKGIVVLADGSPAAKAQMFGLAGNRRYGFCETDEMGEFKMMLPESVSLDKIRIRLANEPESRDCEIVKAKPLTLQVQ